MATDFIEYGRYTFMIFLFPLLGLYLDAFISRKVIYTILTTSLILLLPLLFGYNYVFKYAYGIFALLAFACAYALLLKQFKRGPGIVISVLISALLLLTLFWRTFIGLNILEESWKSGGYRVDYWDDYGFATLAGDGTYALNRYAALPLFIKKIDAAEEKLMENECQIEFSGTGVIFDKCEKKIERKGK